MRSRVLKRRVVPRIGVSQMKLDQVNVGPDLIGLDAVALRLSCTKRHLYTLIKTGKIPSPIHLGAAVRFHRGTIDRWIQAGCPPCGDVGEQVGQGVRG